MHATRLEGAAGVPEVDVVQRRPGDRGGDHGKTLLGQEREHRRHDARTGVRAGSYDASVPHQRGETGYVLDGPARTLCRSLVLQLHLQHVSSELCLELLGGSLDGNATVVDDRQPVREPVGLVEVVRA